MAQKDQRKILIAIDDSNNARNAFNFYLNDIHKAGDYVYCVTVPEYNLAGITVGPLANTESLMKQFNEQREKVEKLCADYTGDLRSKSVSGQMDAVQGNKPGDVILDQAESLGVNMIIMGTRGLSKVKRFMVGSVSSFVVQNSRIPVTIVPSN